MASLSRRVSVDEALFHSVFDQAPIGISIGTDDMATYDSPGLQYSVNRKFEQIMGRNREELKAIRWRDITHPDDLAEDERQLERF